MTLQKEGVGKLHFTKESFSKPWFLSLDGKLSLSPLSMHRERERERERVRDEIGRERERETDRIRRPAAANSL